MSAGAISATGLLAQERISAIAVPCDRAVGYPGRTSPPSRSIVEKGYNLQYWADVPHGGHFAAMEASKLYVQDMRNWAAALKL